MTKPIHTELFAGSGHAVRRFVTETTIQSPADRVYTAWTDAAAFVKVYDSAAPQLKANIDLQIGGRYEWLWDGQMGSNGCQVLSYIPDRMISFSWNAPPSQPDSRAKHTWVVVELEDVDDETTHVTLTHLGFGTAAHWDETLEYFTEAWQRVLAQFKKGLEAGGSLSGGNL